jgi:hypothetical protein
LENLAVLHLIKISQSWKMTAPKKKLWPMFADIPATHLSLHGTWAVYLLSSHCTHACHLFWIILRSWPLFQENTKAWMVFSQILRIIGITCFHFLSVCAHACACIHVAVCNVHVYKNWFMMLWWLTVQCYYLNLQSLNLLRTLVKHIKISSSNFIIYTCTVFTFCK